MNGEVPSVPITTLAGITSLTDLLTELPLPSPLPSAINSKGLLYTPQIAEEAQRLLGRQDENLIPQLLHVLSQTDTDHIELKDKTTSNEVEGEVPALLQAILAHNPNVFKSRVEQLSGSGSGQHSSYSPRGGPSNSSSPAASAPHGNQHQFQQPSSVSGQGSAQAPLNGYAANQFSPAPASSPMFPATPPSVGTPNSQTRSQRSPSRAPATATREDERQAVNSVHNSDVADVRGRASRSQSSEANHTNSNNQPETPIDTQGESSAGMPESDSADAGRTRWSSKRKKRKDRKDKDKKDKEKKDKDEVSYNIIQSPTHSGLPKITLKIARKAVTSPKASESEPSTSGEQSKPPSVEQPPSNSDIKTEVPDQRLQPDANAQQQQQQQLQHQQQGVIRQQHSKELRTEQKVSEPNRTQGSAPARNQQHVDRTDNIVGPPRKSVLRLRHESNSDVQSRPESAAKSISPDKSVESVHKKEEVSRTPDSKGQGDADVAPMQVESVPEGDKEEPMDAEPSEHARAKTAQPRVVLTKLLPSSIEDELIPLKLDGRGKKRGRGSVNYCEISPSSSPRHRPSTSSAQDNEWAPPAASAASSSSRSPSYSRAKAPSPVPEGPPMEAAPIFIERNEEEEEAEENADERPAKRAKKEEKPKPKKKKGQTDAEYEELMDTPTFKRFNTALDAVFENSEDMEVTVDTGDEEEEEYAPDTLISKPLLADLVNEAAKLKSLNVTNQMKTERLVRLLNILERNIRDGTKLNPNDQDEENPREQRLWREVTMERVTRSVDSSLIALYIMTSEDMPKEVFIEDVIDRVAQLAKFQLTNTIYPEFDPVYRVNPKKEVIATHTKLKRARAGEVKEKSVLMVYNKLCTLVANLAELLNLQILTDSTVLLISSMGTAPFFVENVSELQLNSLKLISAVFSRYEKHRQLILEDIFASLARLPSSKKNLRNFRLNNTTNIQMVTALVLQLIQGVVVFHNPDGDNDGIDQYDDVDDDTSKTDQGVLVVNAYETAVRTGQNFLSVFLKKCVSKDEEDYRPLFENFVQDLLSAVNKPEWPAAELLLSLLGRLLMHQFSNRSNEMSMRVSSLEYLGQVASRLRKDAISSVMDEDRLNTIVREMRGGRESPVGDGKPCDKLDYVMNLQQAMVDYLSYNSRNDPAILFSRQFFLAQWYRDTNAEVEQTMKAPQSKTKKKKKDSDDEDSDDDDDDSDEEEEEDKSRDADLKTAEILRAAEKRKKFLISAIKVKKPAGSIRKGKNIITYESAAFVVRYLASRRPFSQSFDIYLTQILRVLNETAVAVRTRAMKCLSQVVAADPNILARADVQKTVHCRFMDQSTSVREAAVELVGRFVLMQPELTDQYYEMLIERILDTGISVRKRVIKTLRDICIDQPEFSKIPEICVRIIRRVNDEEGIKKLVNETFQKMWFTPMPNQNKNLLLQRALNIIEVVAASKDTGYDWLEQLLTNLLKGEEEAHYKPVQKACIQVTDCLVEHVLRLERGSADASEEGKANSRRLVSCLQTLYLFSKVKPSLMVAHATTLQPYLSTKCATARETMVISNVAKILEMVVPLMDHPSEVFLASLEEDMMRLILKHGQMVLQSCVSCLGAIVNRVTHNYRLVRDCFQKYFTILAKMKTDHDSSSDSPISKNKPVLLRSLFTVGLFCKHFDFDAGLKHSKSSPKVPVRDRVFDVLLYFCNREDEDIKLKALSGLGFLCNRHADFMLTTEVKDLYWKILTDPTISVKQLCLVVRNLHLYLVEEDERMRQADAEWKAHAKEEDLKEMGDVQSGMSSSVMQMYLKQVMECMLHTQSMVRMAALQVIVLTLGQGLVHPVQCVPYLVAMGSDPESAIRVKADQQLSEIDRRYPGFIQMKALAGLKTAYKLQELLNSDEDCIRGMRERDNHHYALCSHLYSMIRSNRSHRRAILLSLLNLFDEHVKSDLKLLVFVADNLSSFPYQSQDEPLFIMHHIEIIVSVSGANLLQSFKDSFTRSQPSRPASRTSQNSDSEKPSKRVFEDDDDDDDPESLIERIPEEPTQLLECCVASQAVIMLLVLKQHLKDLYGFRDNTIHRYSPTEAAKVYEKAVNRKSLVHFNPARALDLLKTGQPKPPLNEQEKRDIVEEYLDFKQLMELMDDSDDEEEDGGKPKAGSGPGTPVRNQPGEDGEVKEEVKEEGTNHNDAATTPGGGGGSSPAAARKTPEPPQFSSRTRQVRKHSAEDDEDSSEESIPSPAPVAKSRPRSRTPARSRSRQGGRGGSARKTKPQKKRRRKVYSSDEEDEEDEDSEDPDW